MSPLLLSTKREKLEMGSKKTVDPRKNHVNIYHIKPSPLANAKLEIIVLQCHQGGYNEKVMAWPFYNRNDTTYGAAAKAILEEIQLANIIHKITDGHGNVLKNPSNYEIKAFVKPLASAIVGKLDGKQIQEWWDAVYMKAILDHVPFVQEYNRPIFDYQIDYHVKEHWSDCLGIRNPEQPKDIVSDIQKLVKDEYLDEGTTYNNHVFQSWIVNDDSNGSRFYSLFREGFLSSFEIKSLNIPEDLLRGQDKINMDAYNANLTIAKQSSSLPKEISTLQQTVPITPEQKNHHNDEANDSESNEKDSFNITLSSKDKPSTRKRSFRHL